MLKGSDHSRKPARRVLLLGAGAALLVAAAVTVLTRARHLALPYPCVRPAQSLALQVDPYLRIVIEGHRVPIPAAIGIENPKLYGRIALSGTCVEPIHTHDRGGVIHVESPVLRTYRLGDFFRVWRDTFATVPVNGHNRPVVYTPTDLLGYRTNATHAIRLLVDGKPSRAGPGLDLGHLDYCGGHVLASPCYPTAVTDPYPPALYKRYGVGHRIVLQYVRR